MLIAEVRQDWILKVSFKLTDETETSMDQSSEFRGVSNFRKLFIVDIIANLFVQPSENLEICLG